MIVNEAISVTFTAEEILDFIDQKLGADRLERIKDANYTVKLDGASQIVAVVIKAQRIPRGATR